MRQHVNPLKRELQIRHGPLDWAAVFDDPSLPLVVDVGSGYGRFAIKYVHETPGTNVLGLEIRTPTVDRANQCVSTTCTGWQSEPTHSACHIVGVPV